MGADFSGVRVHSDAQSDTMCRSLQATAFTAGRDLFFRDRAYSPDSSAGQELIAHELTHVVQQGGNQIRRKRDPAGVGISSAPAGRLQRKFGFEVELPMMLTKRADHEVPSESDPSRNLPMRNLPLDPLDRGAVTNLHDLGESYVNVDHSQTLDPLYTAHLDQYAQDEHLDQDARNSLHAADKRKQLMPRRTSLVEVVTKPWDESELNRKEALTKVRSVVAAVNGLYDQIAGNREGTLGEYSIGSGSPVASHFQPRLGYFHATYGVKLAEIPRLFKKTTQQKRRLTRYAKKNTGEKTHAANLQHTSRSIPVAKSAMKQIKKIWPTEMVRRRFLPKTKKVAMSSAAEKEFLGFLTLLANYFLMFKNTGAVGGGGLGKHRFGMHYYKSDLYDVVRQLPDEVTDRLEDNDAVMTGVVDAICAAVGVTKGDDFQGGLSGYTVDQYLHQILRGHWGVLLEADGAPKRDADDQTFMDPVLGHSINPYSKKLGPEAVGPKNRQGLGVVMENRHIEYLNPQYGMQADAEYAMSSQAAAEKSGPKNAGMEDTRDAATWAKQESVGARLAGPARRPIAEWESMMMNIYDMVKGINKRGKGRPVKGGDPAEATMPNPSADMVGSEEEAEGPPPLPPRDAVRGVAPRAPGMENVMEELHHRLRAGV
jgi:hypothetical protein